MDWMQQGMNLFLRPYRLGHMISMVQLVDMEDMQRREMRQAIPLHLKELLHRDGLLDPGMLLAICMVGIARNLQLMQ